MVYLRKVLVSMSYITAWTALHLLVYMYHSFFISHAGETLDHNAAGTPIMETVGLSSITNLLMGTLYMVGYTLLATFQALFSSGDHQTSSSLRIYCRNPPHHEPDTHITPSTLWYYIYSIGLGIFCLSYALHGSHFLSSLCLSVSCMVCSLCIIRSDDPQASHHVKKTVLLFLALLDAFTIFLCVYQEELLLKPQRGLWRNWACECLGPLLAPWALAASRHKVSSIQLPSHQVVLFGLPFVGVLSTGFLSMYIPLQECITSGNNNNNNATTKLLWGQIFVSHPTNTSSASWLSFKDESSGLSTVVMPLLAQDTILGQSILELALAALLVPAATYTALILFTGAFNRPENLLVAAHSLWLVFLVRQAIVLSPAPLFLPAAIIAVLSWLLSLLYLLVHVHLAETTTRWENIQDDLDECLT